MPNGYSWFLRVTPPGFPPTNDPTLSTSYVTAPGQPGCIGTSQICAIYAENQSNGLPIINKAVVDEMVRALDSSCNRVTVQLNW